MHQLEEASAHRSAKTHVGTVFTVFVPRDLDLWHFEPKINCFQDSWWNISTSTLVILAASVFEISCG